MATVKKKNRKKLIDRAVIKSLRTIMQDEFAEVLQSFLENSLNHHAELHNNLQNQNYQVMADRCTQFSDACSHIGATGLVDKLTELQQVLSLASYSGLPTLIEEIDRLYDRCRIELQSELARSLKRTG